MVAIKTILCALDFSEVSPKVAEYAKTLAAACGAKVVALYVAPSLTQYVEFHVQASYIDDFVSGIVNGASDTMDSFIQEYFKGVPVEGRVVSGYAAEEIVNAAEEVNADLIVLGTHGRKGIDKILFGSVAEKVIKTAKAPVLSMRPEIKTA
ncbi:universal stress protein [Desulfovibrio aerotolerans]|uniref:Universal stress protein n=1 Tax=Solidesulfovibrio aerotolerans TaxID=295255 RepID=A0A7C9MKM3_9BACT|nr:universal stress protein [Solidesulfovibrio aerotolerans]MYL83053.1 universal stress protein [Solidesulfovibrio aerotolerans]